MCFDCKHQLLTDQNKTLCTPIYFVMAQAKGESIIYLIVLFCYISSRSPTTLRRHCHPLCVVYVRFVLLLAYVWMCSMARQQQKKKKNIYIYNRKKRAIPFSVLNTQRYTQPHNRRDINTVSFFRLFFVFTLVALGPWMILCITPLLFFFLFLFFSTHCVLFSHYLLLSKKIPFNFPLCTRWYTYSIAY